MTIKCYGNLRILTNRERDVVNLIAVECLSNKEAARRLGLSPRTVEDHRANVVRKLSVRNFAELVRYVALSEPN